MAVPEFAIEEADLRSRLGAAMKHVKSAVALLDGLCMNYCGPDEGERRLRKLYCDANDLHDALGELLMLRASETAAHNQEGG